ncbi:DUF3021 domain-containing protein [Pseudogracilibacillus sp. ICA-222130]|uniref:DUF3021 domain-containing protein n=1 Tax=Pseudogracilibacillus sp. ICA-222130 TaxID=3134655 RepID=UPI0030BC21A4
MASEIMKRGIYGLAYGGVVTFIALTVLMVANINPSIQTIWLYTSMGFVLSLYFAFASFIFDVEKWSPLKKTIIHYSLSVIVYFIIAFSVGWVPIRIVPIFISIIMFTVVYLVFWYSYRIYYKRVEASMNESLMKNK